MRYTTFALGFGISFPFKLLEVVGVTVFFQDLGYGGYGNHGIGFSEVFEALRNLWVF